MRSWPPNFGESEFRMILYLPGLRNTEAIIVNRMVHMEVEDKDQVVALENDGLVPIVHVQLLGIHRIQYPVILYYFYHCFVEGGEILVLQFRIIHQQPLTAAPNTDPCRVARQIYRYEQITVRSEHQFYQMEGLAVGKGIRLTDLIGVLSQFARRLYGEGRRLRVRGSYFPFTEPSIEADMDCILCAGKGCAVCKYTGWLEIGGAGMVHPVVLRNGGYDPDVYSGFAFGLGVERPTMLKNRISDIRYFYGNDLRFLGQFDVGCLGVMGCGSSVLGVRSVGVTECDTVNTEYGIANTTHYKSHTQR